MFVPSLCLHPHKKIPRRRWEKNKHGASWSGLSGLLTNKWIEHLALVGGGRVWEAARQTSAQVLLTSPFTACPAPGPLASLTLAGAGSSSGRSLAGKLPCPLVYPVLYLPPPSIEAPCSSTITFSEVLTFLGDATYTKPQPTTSL